MSSLALGLVNPLVQFLGDDGLPLAFGFVQTFAAGTTSPLLTYKDAFLTVPNSTTIALDAEGKAIIYLQPLAYKIDVQDANGVSIDGYPVDNILGISAVIDNGLSDFRLSLQSGVAVTGDILAATTLYLTPFLGNRLALLDSNGNPTILTSSEISIPIPAAASQLYDVFGYNNGGTPTLELLAWTNDSTRATNLTRSGGVSVKSGNATRRYLGSFRTTAVSGQSENSQANRLVWNAVNRVRQNFTYTPGGNWAYTTATQRQANGSALSQVTAVVGLAQSLVSLRLPMYAQNTNAGVQAATTIGLDTAVAGGAVICTPGVFVCSTINVATMATAVAEYVPNAGYHRFTWLEESAATGTTTWTSGATILGATALAGGLYGSVDC